MGKTDAKGEPVQTVTIGGKKVDVPIIFILPEESGSKEIERYLHPKVHIESKKVAPLLAGAGAATGIGVATGAAAGGVAAAGKKIGEGVKNTVGEGIGAVGDAAKLSETLSSESEEKPLEELTHGKLEEVEKLPFAVPKEESEANKGYSDDFKRGGFKQQQAPLEEEEENTPYFDLLSPEKPKKKKKKRGNSYKELLSAEKSWEKWLQKKQTRIDRKQEWGDKSKIGVGSWEDNPELKPKGRFDKDGKRIRERGQGEGKPREGAL